VNSQSLKWMGIICLVLAGILAFVAFERYQTNANNVRAMSGMMQNNPAAQMMGVSNSNIKPATPAATKYALIGMAVFAGAGIFCLMQKGKNNMLADTP